MSMCFEPFDRALTFSEFTERKPLAQFLEPFGSADWLAKIQLSCTGAEL